MNPYDTHYHYIQTVSEKCYCAEPTRSSNPGGLNEGSWFLKSNIIEEYH